MQNYEITLRLSDIRDLFIAPAVDPFSEHEANFMGQSGLERIVRRLTEHLDKKHPPKIILKVPRDMITADLESRIQKSIRRYADLKIAENGHRYALARRQGLRKLLPGLLFLGLCLTLAILVESPAVNLTDFVKSILSESFTIIGWVVLWHPVEAFLYEPTEIRAENKVYHFLKHLPISIVGE